MKTPVIDCWGKGFATGSYSSYDGSRTFQSKEYIMNFQYYGLKGIE